MKFKKWIHQDSQERRLLTELNEFWENNAAVRKQLCEPAVNQAETLPLLNEAVKIALQIKAQLEHKHKKKKITLRISPVHELLHNLEASPSSVEADAFVRNIVHSLFRKTNRSYEGGLTREELDRYIDQALELYHALQSQGVHAVHELAHSIDKTLHKLAERWRAFTRTQAFTQAEGTDEHGQLNQRALTMMRSFERTLNHLADDIDRTETMYLAAAAAKSAAATAAAAGSADESKMDQDAGSESATAEDNEAKADMTSETKASQQTTPNASMVSEEAETTDAMTDRTPVVEITPDDTVRSESNTTAPIVEEPVAPIVEEPHMTATPSDEVGATPMDDVEQESPSHAADVQSETETDTTTTPADDEEEDEEDEEERKADQDAAVAIQRIRESFDQVDDDIASLRNQADELNIDKLTATPLASSKHVEKLTRGCIGLSEQLLKELFKLDGLVVGSDAVRKERKETVNHIQAMLDDCDRIKRRLRTLSNTLEPLAEEEKKRIRQEEEEQARKQKEAAEAQAASAAAMTASPSEMASPHTRPKASTKSGKAQKSKVPRDEEDTESPLEEVGGAGQEDTETSSLHTLWKLLRLKPRFDTSETRNAYVLSTYLPNMKPGDFKVKMQYGPNRNAPTDAVARASTLLPEPLKRHVSGEVSRPEDGPATGIVISGTRMPTPQEEAILLERIRQLRRSGHPQLNSQEAVQELLLRMGSGRFGTFSQEFQLPEDVDPDGIQASYRDDCFKVILPKLPLERRPSYLAAQRQRQQELERLRQQELLRQQQQRQMYAPQRRIPQQAPYFPGLGTPYGGNFFGDRDLWW